MLKIVNKLLNMIIFDYVIANDFVKYLVKVRSKISSRIAIIIQPKVFARLKRFLNNKIQTRLSSYYNKLGK